MRKIQKDVKEKLQKLYNMRQETYRLQKDLCDNYISHGSEYILDGGILAVVRKRLRDVNKYNKRQEAKLMIENYIAFYKEQQ